MSGKAKYAPPPPLWQQAIDGFTEALLAQQLSEQTIELRRYHLRRVAREIGGDDPAELKGMDLVQWAGRQEWDRETRRAVRSSMKRFFGWMVEAGLAEKNIGEMLPAVKPREPRPKPIAHVDLNRAYTAADPRVKLAIRLSVELGLRRAEVAQLFPDRDVIGGPGNYTLVVHGKGDKVRKVPLPDDLARGILDQADGDWLFPSLDGGHTKNGGHISPHWMGTLVSKALGDAGTMHSLRHTCATDLHNETKDLRLVQTVLGHASVATTQRYVGVDDDEVRSAVLGRSAALREDAE